MDLEKIKTIDYFEDDPEKERRLAYLRDTIEQKIQAAFDLSCERFGNDITREEFFECLKVVWPENNGRKTKPHFFIDFEHAGETKRLTVIFGDSSSGAQPIFEVDGIIKELSLNIGLVVSYGQKKSQITTLTGDLS